MTLSILSGIIYARNLKELKMFYLIFCAVMLAFEMVCFLLCFLPFVSITLVDNHYYKDVYKFSVFKFLEYDETRGILLFILAFFIILIVLTIILLAKIVKNCNNNSSSSSSFMVFNLIITMISSFHLVLFIILRVKADAFCINYYRYISNNDSTGYYGFTPLSVIVTILFVLNFILSVLMLIIITVNMFNHKLKNSKFFTIIVGQTSEPKTNKRDIFDIKNQSQNIELLEKYNELFKNGVITEEEFNEKKKELL